MGMQSFNPNPHIHYCRPVGEPHVEK